MTYRELASAVGSPRASRAIGNACAQNRLLIVVPCHRVLAESGLGGFRLGLAWKRRLLELESELAACES
jgi:O-6-methylguanine DNA methyltransferase